MRNWLCLGKTDLIAELYLLGEQHLASGNDFESIKEKLLKRCEDEEIISIIVKNLKTEYYTRRRKEGTQILGAGLILILLGFVITCFNYHSNQSVTLAMYGLTSLGILVVFYGLYKIMG